MTEESVDKEIKWIRAHFKALEEKYPGNYIAVLNNKVVASGFTGKAVIEQVKKKGIDETQPRYIHMPAAKTIFYGC